MSFGFGIGDFIAAFELADQIRKRWRDAPAELASIRKEIKNVRTILEDIDELKDSVTLNQRQTSNLKDACATCVTVLQECESFSGKHTLVANPAPDTSSRIKRAWSRAKLDPVEIRQLRDRLASSVTQLTAIENGIELDLTQHIRNDVRDLRRDDVENEKEKIANWLAPSSFAEQYTDFLERHQTGTGQWFLESSQYTGWTIGQINKLMCTGIPGSGKTMMATLVIDDLHKLCLNAADVTVIYHYCDYTRRDEQKLSQILSILVRQLFQQRKDILPQIKQLYQIHKDRQTRPQGKELREVFRALLDTYRLVFLVMDGVDECRNDDLTREAILDFLLDEKLLRNGLKVIATSRPNPEISDRFHNSEHLEIRASTSDILRYLDGQMGRVSAARGNSNLQSDIKDCIVKSADGMFLLAALHLNFLADRSRPREIREALQSLPTGSEALEKAYERVRTRIDQQRPGHRTLAHQILSFITHSRRLLRIEELQHALAIETGMRVAPGEEDIHPEPLMLEVCAGLVIVDPESRFIRLVHYTAQEYLEYTRNEWFPCAEPEILSKCLSYLQIEEIKSNHAYTEHEYDKRLQSYPFLDFAAVHWASYVPEEPQTVTIDEILRFLDDDSAVAVAAQVGLREIFEENMEWVFGDWRITALHLATYYGLRDVSLALIDRGIDVNSADWMGRTPLHWAASYCESVLAEIFLLQERTDANIRDKNGLSPFLLAIERGSYDVIKVFLNQTNLPPQDHEMGKRIMMDHEQTAQNTGDYDQNHISTNRDKIDLNLRDSSGRTALSYAIIYGGDIITKLLNEHPGFDVGVQTVDELALISAILKGQQETVRVLLAHQVVDINLIDKSGRTALMWAVSSGQEENVKLLLRSDAINVNLANEKGETALMKAAARQNTVILKLLLEHGRVEVNLHEDMGWTALMWAVSSGKQDNVELLLSRPGIDVNQADIQGQTTLIKAALDGNLEAIESLLDRPEIEVNSQAIAGYTALMYSAARGFTNCAEVLISHSQINTTLKDYRNQTALALACRSGHMEMVELLLRRDRKSINTPDISGITPLIRSVLGQNKEIALLLLKQRKIRIASASDPKGINVLLELADLGWDEVIQLVVHRGLVQLTSTVRTEQVDEDRQELGNDAGQGLTSEDCDRSKYDKQTDNSRVETLAL